jgi:DNA-binding NtrC family response regulator
LKPTLLIAESDADLRDVYRKFLGERDYEVETASDGLDCLAKLRQRMPAVLVLDLELPWGGGDGVLAWLREHRVTAGLPVVLTAAAGCSPDATKDIRPPVVEFLPKPFTLTTLLWSVRTAVAKKGREEPFNLNRAAGCSELFIG